MEDLYKVSDEELDAVYGGRQLSAFGLLFLKKIQAGELKAEDYGELVQALDSQNWNAVGQYLLNKASSDSNIKSMLQLF